MRVRMKTLGAGPGVMLLPGHEYDLADELARQLVIGGYAEAVRVQRLETAAVVTTPFHPLSTSHFQGDGKSAVVVEPAAVSIETVGRKKPGKVKK